jgi:GH24 family phage-related lysozyme (muramidase)
MLRATDVGVLASCAVAYSRRIAAEKKIVAESTVITVTCNQGQTKPLKHTMGLSVVRHRRLRTPTASLKAAATALLLQDAGYAEHAVQHLLTVPLSQGQYSALVSFVYNEGAGRLQTSTLRTDLNAGNYAAVPGQMAEWVYGGGVKLPGLVIRRQLRRRCSKR